MGKRLAIFLAVSVALLLGSAAQAANITLGETSILSSADNGNGGYLLAQGPYNLSQTATIQSLSFYVTTASGQLRLGIYTSGTNNDCKGGTLKAQTAAFTPVKNSWNTANVATQVLLPVGNYCLAYTPSSSSLAFRKGVTTGVNEVNQPFTFGTMPATFSASATGDNAHWSFYATLAPQVPTITGMTLSCGSSCGFVGGSASVQTIGTIAVQESNGTFGGTFSLSDTTHFQLSSSTLQAKAGVVAGSYPLTITATQSGVSGSPFPEAFTIVGSQPPAIYGITLSSSSFLGGSSTGTTIGTIGVSEQNGTFGGTLALSDTTHFQLTSSSLPSTLETLTTDAPATYPLTITATQSGVVGSPFPASFSIVGTGITGISLSNSQFVGGSASGTAVGQISVAELGGTFGGTYGISGADAASFTIAGGWLYTSGSVAAGTYNIIITATQAGVGASPKSQAFVITGTASGSQQWFFLTSNQTFQPTAHGLIATNPITIEAIGSGSASASGDNAGGCGGAYAHQAGTSYALVDADVASGMAVTVGAAGVVGGAGNASTILNGSSVPLVSAGGGGAVAGSCAGGQVLVGTGYSGGIDGLAPSDAGGGGGGSAGPKGAGGNAGAGATSYPGGGGGGGAANGLGNAADTGATANGGPGGGPNGGAGGSGNTTPTNGAVGMLGSGGGGGGGTTSGAANAGNGGSGGQACNIWDNIHCLSGGVGGGGSGNAGAGGNGGAPVGYGCGGGGFGSAATVAGTSSAGCPGLVVIGWNGQAPAQSIGSVTLSGSSYTVGAAANTVIGTIAVAMSPTSPAFNYPTSTIAVSNTTDFKVVNVGGVPTLEANTTLSAGSYTTTITATQSSATNSPFVTGTLTITGRTLSLSVTPSATPSLPSNTPSGTTVATLQGVWSNADPFTGTYACSSTCDSSTFSLAPGSGSSNLLIINPSGPGVGFDGGTVQNVTVTATQ